MLPKWHISRRHHSGLAGVLALLTGCALAAPDFSYVPDAKWRAYYMSPESQSSLRVWESMGYRSHADEIRATAREAPYWLAGLPLGAGNVVSIESAADRYGVLDPPEDPIRAVFLDPVGGAPHSDCSILVAGGYHAREPATTLVALKVLKLLLKGEYPRATNRCRFTVVWNANPDGFRKLWASPPDAPLWRKNARGVDPNRNYPVKHEHQRLLLNRTDPLSQTYAGPHPGSEPETRVMMEMGKERRFTLCLALHSWGDTVLSPYPRLQREGDALASIMNARGLAFRSELSKSPGTHAQYVTDVAPGNVGLTVELFRAFIPSSSTLRKFAETYSRGLLDYCEDYAGRRREAHRSSPPPQPRRLADDSGLLTNLSHRPLLAAGMGYHHHSPKQLCPAACQSYSIENAMNFLRVRYDGSFGKTAGTARGEDDEIDCSTVPVSIDAWQIEFQKRLDREAIPPGAGWAVRYRAVTAAERGAEHHLWVAIRWILRKASPVIATHDLRVDLRTKPTLRRRPPAAWDCSSRAPPHGEMHAVVIYGQACTTDQRCHYKVIDNGVATTMPKNTTCVRSLMWADHHPPSNNARTTAAPPTLRGAPHS